MISARRRLRGEGDRIAGALRQLLQLAEERGKVARLRRVEQTQRLAKPLRVEAGVLAGEGAPQAMQATGGAGVFSGGEMLGVAQSRFVLAQAQDFCARRGGFESETLAQRAGEGRVLAQDSVEQSEAGAGGEKGGGGLALASSIRRAPMTEAADNSAGFAAARARRAAAAAGALRAARGTLAQGKTDRTDRIACGDGGAAAALCQRLFARYPPRLSSANTCPIRCAYRWLSV